MENKSFKKILLFLIFTFVSLWLLFHFIECRNKDPFDSFRIILTYYLGEYCDFQPKTFLGKLIITLAFILGVVICAALIGNFASYFIKLREKGGKMPIFKDHIVICNWNEKGESLIKEIRAGNLEIPICIIADKGDDEINLKELFQKHYFQNVFFIRGDPSSHYNLKNLVFAHEAKTVIILADDTTSDPDAKTALIGLAITKLEKEKTKKTHIIAEIVNHRKIQHLIDAGIDEYICSNDYGILLMSQSALYHKLTEVYHQLLTYSPETCEIYLIEDLPKELLGKTFQEAISIINDKRDENNPIIPLGVKREEKFILNPKKEDFDFFKEGDCLIVVSYYKPEKLI